MSYGSSARGWCTCMHMPSHCYSINLWTKLWQNTDGGGTFPLPANYFFSEVATIDSSTLMHTLNDVLVCVDLHVQLDPWCWSPGSAQSVQPGRPAPWNSAANLPRLHEFRHCNLHDRSDGQRQCICTSSNENEVRKRDTGSQIRLPESAKGSGGTYYINIIHYVITN